MKVRSKRGKAVRLIKKPKTQFFKISEPYERDRKLRDRAEVLSSEVDLRYDQSKKISKPKSAKSKRAKEAEIIEKETKHTSKAKKTKKKK